MTAPKILVTTRSFRKMDGPHQQILLDAGYELVNSPLDRPLTAPELARLIPGIDAAILGVDDVGAEVFEQADRLRVVSRYGIGVDRVDLAAATAKGVVVTNTPGGNTNAVAELALGFMLALARNIPRQDRQIRREDWSLLKGVELAGKTLGLLGMGRIGQRVAELGNAFGMKILFYDPYPPAEAFLEKIGAQLISLEAVLTQSDFLSLHLPLTPDTRNLLDAAALAMMKKGAFLINTARGGLVDETALVKVLQAGTIGGAAFDAFEEEPAKGNPLLELENFISTPH
ncbi:MAG: phosphoglycerate dehydrogenase, partial [Anaerolineae bacterium]|nr:phosphoglycerate dehydrogenase [Anaerolineae bacterium]